MAYDLFFLPAIPALGVRMPTPQWVESPMPNPLHHKDIVQFLGVNSRWYNGKVGRIGYGRCVQAFLGGPQAEIRFPLNRRQLRKSLLTLTFLLNDRKGWDEGTSASVCEMYLDVGCDLQNQYVSGEVSIGFKRRLELLSDAKLQEVALHMRRAYKAVAPRECRILGESCYAGVHDGCFELGFADGSSCDASMYPDTNPAFGCHNVDSVFQLAALLAGLFSLHEFVRTTA